MSLRSDLTNRINKPTVTKDTTTPSTLILALIVTFHRVH